MTISLSSLLTGFEEFIDAVAVESTADAGSDATKIVDSVLSIYGDNYFQDWWAVISSGDALGEIRRIENFNKSTTTLDPYVDFSVSVALATYEIHKNNPDSIKTAINNAIGSIYPKLYREIVFESLGYDTLNANVAIGATSVVLSNDASRFFVGQVCTIGDTAGSETITLLTVNPSTNTVTFAAIKGAYTTAKTAYLVAQSGKYFNLGATIGNARVIGLYSRADSTSKRKRITNFEIITNGDRQIYFPDNAVSVDDQTWIIEAQGRLEALSDPTDYITLEDERAVLLYAESAYHLYLKQANNVSAGDYQELMALANRYKQQTFTDYRNLWMPRMVEVADISTDGD